jgi:hypothetical protein
MSTNQSVQAQRRQEEAHEMAKAQHLQATLTGILNVLGEINQKLDRLVKVVVARDP